MEVKVSLREQRSILPRLVGWGTQEGLVREKDLAELAKEC